MIVREEEPADAAAIREVVEAAFRRPLEAELVVLRLGRLLALPRLERRAHHP
jgi:hypothetical protein